MMRTRMNVGARYKSDSGKEWGWEGPISSTGCSNIPRDVEDAIRGGEVVTDALLGMEIQIDEGDRFSIRLLEREFNHA